MRRDGFRSVWDCVLGKIDRPFFFSFSPHFSTWSTGWFKAAWRGPGRSRFPVEVGPLWWEHLPPFLVAPLIRRLIAALSLSPGLLGGPSRRRHTLCYCVPAEAEREHITVSSRFDSPVKAIDQSEVNERCQTTLRAGGGGGWGWDCTSTGDDRLDTDVLDHFVWPETETEGEGGEDGPGHIWEACSDFVWRLRNSQSRPGGRGQPSNHTYNEIRFLMSSILHIKV